MPEPTPASLWQHADFVKLWGGQSISELGSQVSVLALPLTAVLVLHATAFEVGALNAVLMAPFLVLGLPAGAIIDRLPMRTVMIVADAARLVVLGSIPLAAALHGLTLGQLYAAAFFSGIGTVFFDVAYQSYLPLLLTADQLTDGNGKLTATSQVAAIAGPAAGGALVSAIGAAKAIGADAVSYLFSVVSLVAIRHRSVRPEPEDGAATTSLLADTKQGLRFVTGHPMLRKIAGCTGTSNLTGDIAWAVMTVFMVRTLHLSAARIGLLYAIGSVAGLIGALVARRLITAVGVGRTIVGAAFVTSVGALGQPLATPGAGVWWLAASFAVFWLGAVTYNVAQVSLRQAITPPDMLGRMNATMRFMVWGPMPIGALVGGALGGAIGLRETLWVGAIGGLVSPLFVLFSPVRSLRDIPLDDDRHDDDDTDDVDVPATIEPSPIGPLPL